MTSTFTWRDYSEERRLTMLAVIDLFGEKTTRDEWDAAACVTQLRTEKPPGWSRDVGSIYGARSGI